MHEGDLLQRVHRLRAISVDLEVARAEFARLNDLGGTDIRALIALLDADRAGTPARPGWLGARLGLSTASTTALIDRLAEAGLVDRKRDPGDRRKVLVVVTEQAITLGWSFFGPLLGRMVEALRGFDEHEVAIVDRFLEQIAAAVCDR